MTREQCFNSLKNFDKVDNLDYQSIYSFILYGESLNMLPQRIEGFTNFFNKLEGIVLSYKCGEATCEFIFDKVETNFIRFHPTDSMGSFLRFWTVGQGDKKNTKTMEESYKFIQETMELQIKESLKGQIL